MNEKIKELAEQATLTAVTKNFNGTSVEVQVPSENWAKEFAESIVQECVEICNQAILQNQDTLSKLNEDELAEKMVIHGSINQAQKLGKGIKQHFGVEE